MFGPDRTSFVIDADSIAEGDRFVGAGGRMRVTVREAVMDLVPGDRVELFGYLYRPLQPVNPGQYDWATWHRRHGLHAAMSCNYRESVLRLETGEGVQGAQWLGGLRRRARGLLLDEMLSYGEPETTLLGAMILASRSGLDPSIHQAFVRTGASHYLAVSGFHVGMLALFLYGAGRLVGLGRRPSAVIVAVATVAYAVLAEPRPPIFRATVLTLAICAAMVLGRGRTYFNWLALSAICYVIWRPMELFDVGFQMSYACVAGILLLTPAIGDLLRWLAVQAKGGAPAILMEELADPTVRRGFWGRLKKRVLVLPPTIALAAWLSSVPLLIFNFQQFSPWGWLNTLLLFPPVVVVMFVGFGTLLAGAVSPLVAGMLTPVIEVPAGVLVWWVGWLGKVPGVTVFTSAPPTAWVVLYCAALLSWVAHHRRVVRWPVAVGFTLACTVVTAFWLAPSRPSGKLTMTVLSVGRGTSIVIELPKGGAMLYDAGCSGSYDPGASAIVPFLASRGIGRLETAIISHPNLDHFGGLPSVADRVSIGSVMVSPHFEPLSPRTKPSSVLLEELDRRRVPLRLVDSSAQSFEIGGAKFEILWPPTEPPFEPTANESSIVVRVTYRGQSILLAGDIEGGAQEYLISRGVDLSADVLALPHHGSVRRPTRKFVEAVSPTYLLRSTSQRNAQNSAQLQLIIGGGPLYNTADDGAIQVVLDGSSVDISTFGSARSRDGDPDSGAGRGAQPTAHEH
jgi:competence protein ComEC